MANLIKNFKNLSLILLLASCSYFQNHQTDNKPQIRIVDLNGKPHNVKTRMPQLNAEAIAKINENNNSSNRQVQNSDKRIVADNHSATLNANSYGQYQADQQDESGKFDPSGYQVQNVELNNIDNKAVSEPKSTNVQAAAVAESGDKSDQGSKRFDFTSEQSNQSNQLANNSLLINANSGKKSFKFGGSKVKASQETEQKIIKVKNNTHGIFVQTGVFSSASRADHNLHQVSAFHKGEVEEVAADGKKLYKVLIGPFANKKQAQIVIKKLSKSGQKSFIVKK